jgi:hypothetical protein
MFKVRAILLGLAVAAIAVATSAATASAAGPLWRLNGAALESGKTIPITGENYSGTVVKLKTTIQSVATTILCSAAIKGALIGGSPGKGEETIEYKSCSVEGLSGCEVTLSNTNALTELGYEASEMKLILDVLYTTGGFTSVTIKKGTGTCSLTLSATEVKPAKEKYDVALIDTHPEVEESTGLFMGLEPALKEAVIGGTTVSVGLVLEGQTATLEADLLIKSLTSELKFAAFKE